MVQKMTIKDTYKYTEKTIFVIKYNRLINEK